MNHQPNLRQTGMPESSPAPCKMPLSARLAWLPIPAFLLAILLLWVFGVQLAGEWAATGLALGVFLLTGTIIAIIKALRHAQARVRRMEARVLLENDERLELVLEASSTGAFEIDLASNQGRWNPVQFQLLGLEPGEASPSMETFLRFVHPDDQKQLSAQWKEALRTGQFNAEFRIVRADGALRWLAGRGRFIAGDGSADSVPRRFLGIHFDITERKLAEAAQARLAAIVESSQDAIIGNNLEGRVTSWNAAATELFGYTAEEMVGRPIMVLIPAERSLEETEILRRVTEGEAISNFETERLRKDGRQIVVSLTVSPVKDANGKVIGCAKIAHDITSRHLAEEDRDRYIALVKNSGDFIGMCDLQGIPFFINEAGMKLVGMDDPSQFPHVPVIDYFFPEDQEFIVKEFLPKALQGPAEVEIRFRHFKTGAAIWMIYNVFALRDRDGNPTGFATVSRNITERKRMEQALLASEQFKQGVLDSLPAHIAVIDAEGTILAVNRPWMRFAEENGNPEACKVAVGSNYLEVCRRASSNGEPTASAALQGLTAVLSGALPHFELEYPCDTLTQKRWYVVHALKPTVDIGGAIITHLDITERKQAEEALRVSQQHNAFLANILENTSQPFGIAYPDQRMGLTNKAFQTLVGYSAEELESMDWAADLTPEEWRESEAAKLKELNQTGKPVRYVKQYLRKDGRRVPVELLANAAKDAEGNTAYYYAFVTDITVRMQAEEALRHSQADLNRAQAVARTGSWRLDVRRNELSWSDENYRLFGIPKDTPSSLSYETFLSIVHPDDREFVDKAWMAALAGKPYDVEHRIIVDNKVKWARERAELEFDDQGNLLGAFGTTQDISEKKYIQQALQQERSFLRQILDATPSMIFVKDRDGRFLLGNETLAQGYGTTTAALIGKSDADFNPSAEEVAQFLSADRETIDTATPKRISLEPVTLANGETRWFSTVKVPLFEPDGSCLKLLGVATDITERKQAEEALKEADRRKDEFLAMLAHELRNPLTPIMVAAQMLQKRGAEDPALVKWAGNTVKHQCENLTQLVNQLLDVSRVTEGKITLRKKLWDLRDVMGRAVESSMPFINQHDHELTVSSPPELIPAEVDGVRIEQILGNLLNNAAKYTPPGGNIWLSLEREAKMAVFRVRDSGIGISAAMQTSVFDLFTQAERTLDRAQGGLGIGLALVKSLVEMHGGSVKASSAGIGMGSEFEVRLPLSAQALPANETAAEPFPQAPAKMMHILVVDDNDDVRISQALLLRAMGHQVWEACTGQQALDMRDIAPWDAMLIDIGMPGLNGYEVARQLRQDPAFGALTLIAMSGYSQEHDRQRSLQAGFDHYLVKPFEPSELAALLAGLGSLPLS